MKFLLWLCRFFIKNVPRKAKRLLTGGKSDGVDKILGRAKGKVIERAIGQTVTCEDGKDRLVETISYSVPYRQMAVVNELDQDGGAFVHLYRLFCQLEGLPAPSTAEMRRYDQKVERRARTVQRRMKKNHGIAPFFRKWNGGKKED